MDSISSNGHESDAWRTQPMYTISDAAHLAHVAPVTVRRWLHGYAPDPRYPEWRSPPVFGPNDATVSLVSFLQLIEIVVASDFRKISHLKLEVVRDAHANLRTEKGIEYPFAHVELESLGDHVVRWLQGEARAQAIDAPAQFSLPGLIEQRTHEMVERRLSELDFERKLAARWYPVGKEIPIVVDPLYSAGLPTVVGRGVTVGAIYRRWKADPKDNIDFIADDLQLDTQLVERVLKYADKIAA
jgi:uncharacterized protein (DUF433 family)